MRIGNVILDTDNMSIDEISGLIKELRNIRDRKAHERNLKEALTNLLNDAHENKFDFVMAQTGEVLRAEDIVVWDNH
jgi:hypothetical protein